MLPLEPLAVDEHHRPLDGTDGRQRVTTNAQAVIDAVGHLQSLGVTQTMVPLPPARSLDEHLDGLRWIAEEIIPAFR